MASFDINAIRAKIAELNGEKQSNNGKSNVQLWKPEVGTYKIRGVPWKASMVVDGLPLLEKNFYHFGDITVSAPFSYGEADPVKEFMGKLYSTKEEADRTLAKKLYPKSKSYMAIVLRGEEDKSDVPLVWQINKQTCGRILSFYTDEELQGADILDPETGFDLKVEIKKSGKKSPTGYEFVDIVVDPARSSTKLHADPKKMKAFLDNVPNVDEMYPRKSYAEIKQILENWINDGCPDYDAAKARKTSLKIEDKEHAPKSKVDELDKLQSEVKKASTPAVVPTKKVEKKVEVQKKYVAPQEEESDDSSKALDDAFAELENDA